MQRTEFLVLFAFAFVNPASAQFNDLHDRSLLTVACKTQVLMERFIDIYYGGQPNAAEVVERLKTTEEPRPCFFGGMSLTVRVDDLVKQQPLFRRDIAGNREAQILKVTVDGRWTGNVYWPQVPMERYILHLLLKDHQKH